MINEHFQEITKKATGASEIYVIGVIQNLWSGYGEIVRYGLKGIEKKTIIVKHVNFPERKQHPRGWNTDHSHQRKIHSYEVETTWYEQWNHWCDDSCRTPHCLALETEGNEVLMVLEDLDDSGYGQRKSSVTIAEMQVCLSWLAGFHATFMGQNPLGLWPVGTYWHLDTRPDELQALKDINLKQAAAKIDQKLKDSPYQSFVHGDAKLANFCFSADAKKVAAVDFQYVGGGCGMKDVAYFIGSCLNEEDCARLETQLLDYYFAELKTALTRKKIPVDPDCVEQDWRSLYPLAWTDFHRFIKGWSPGHWKIHGYSEQLARQVIALLNENTG